MTSDPVLAVLTSIDTTLKHLLALVQHAQPVKTREAPTAAKSAVASDHELDGPDADEIVKLKPRDWTGDDFREGRMSQCPPEYLELLATAYDYFAKRSDEKGEVDSHGRPKSFYALRTARRARGWAARLRAHKVTGAQAPLQADDIPWSTSNW